MNQERTHMRGLSRWVWIAGVWLAIGVFNATQTVFSMRAQGMHHSWNRLFLTLSLAWIPMAVATPFILRLSRRFPPVSLRPISTWVAHLISCAVVCVIGSAWAVGFEISLNPWANPATPGPISQMLLYKIYGSIVSYLVLYSSILGIGHAVAYRDRLAQKEVESARLSEQLTKARLDALRRQVEPHFLFNALNSIAGLVREERNDDAVKMIAALSDFLRRVVEDSSRQEVPLSDEIEFVQKYLEIQKVRFAERLLVTLEVSPEVTSVPVPFLILQPIVENAIKHGIEKRLHGGEVRINANRMNGSLLLKVYNDGPPMGLNREVECTGVGLENVRTRLESLYGSAFEFDVISRPPDGVEVRIAMPFRES